jgi:hypothetical protein
MELSKYNKLEKLGFTFWTKRQDIEVRLQSYLIGESVIALSSFRASDLGLNARERFIYSVACFLNKDSVKKTNIERVTQEDIRIALLFGYPKIEILEKDDIKILSYPSVDEICRTTSAKKEFLMRFKEDLI